jgi:glycogen synthase
MKIVFLDFDDIKNPLLAAGQAKATYEVGRRLSEKGHAVTVISSRYPGYSDRQQNGIVYKHIGIGSKRIRFNNILYILSLPFAVKDIDADVVVECFTAPISTLFTPLFTHVPVVALPSSFEAEHFSEKYHMPFKYVERFGSKFYKYFLPYSHAIDQKMKKLNPHVISMIVPEGVDKEYFTIKKKTPKHIFFLGRMDIDQKGIDLLLKAYKKIEKQIAYPLVIAGNGPDEQKVNKLIKELHLEDKVTMTGATYGHKKMKLLSESLYVALPSRHETFSCFALEALASGLPLVTYDIPGLSWTDKGSVVKAKAYDVDEYASSLLTTSKNKQLNQMSNKARTFASQYTWENVTDKFESFFTQITTLQSHNNYAKT